MRSPACCLFFALAASTGLSQLSTPAFARDAVAQSKLYGSSHRFDVIRKGKKIGQYTTRFSRSGKKLTVKASMNLNVGIIGIPVFKYTYNATETWSGDRLTAFNAKTNNNGKRVNVNGQAKGGKFIWTTNGQAGSTSLPLFPTNHWNVAMTKQPKVFNSFDGKVNKVSVSRLGSDKISCNGRTISARKYRYTGQLKAESWYDGSGRWVALRLKAEDGSQIDFLCPGGKFL